MLKNPHLNALFAAIYIAGVVFVMDSVTSVTHEKETILVPMTVLSLFVLSVAVMTMLFFYTPVKMFLGDEKDEALKFFLKTLGAFALCVIIFASLLFIL